MPPHRKIGGILFYPCPSLHSSVCTNLTLKLIFHLLLNQFSYKAHIWYGGTCQWHTSGCTKVKVIALSRFNTKVIFSKTNGFWGISVSKKAICKLYGQRRKCFSFSHNVFHPIKDQYNILSNIIKFVISKLDAFNLDLAKIL